MKTRTFLLALLACFLLLLGCADLRERRNAAAQQGGGEAIPSPGSAQQAPTAGRAQQDSSGAAQQGSGQAQQTGAGQQQGAQAGATSQGGGSGEPENPQQQSAAAGASQSAANPQALLSLTDSDLDILEDSDSGALDDLPLADEG